jgi:hypothetical protein
MEHLCDNCIFSGECSGDAEYPVLDCIDFDDGYEGPEYPDGDAYREYMNVSLFRREVIGHEDEAWVCQ